MADDNKQTPQGNLPFRGTNTATDLPPVSVAASATAAAPPPAKVLEPPVPPQPAVPVGRPKEMEPGTAKTAETSKTIETIAEIPSQVEVEKKPELQGFLEPVQKEETNVPTVVDDYTQEILLKQAGSGGTITLPLTEEEIQEDLHRDIWESVRWLAEWCVRQMKLLHGKVVYRKK